MVLARRHPHLTAWIALVAMLAFALVPTLSRALALAEGASAWTEVCTPQGMKVVSTIDGTTAPLHTAVHLDHCAFCGLAADGAVALPSLASVQQGPQQGADVPRLFLHALTTAHAWRSAQPRAPPFAS